MKKCIQCNRANAEPGSSFCSPCFYAMRQQVAQQLGTAAPAPENRPEPAFHTSSVPSPSASQGASRAWALAIFFTFLISGGAVFLTQQKLEPTRTLRAGATWAVHEGYLEGYGIASGAGIFYVTGRVGAGNKVKVLNSWRTEMGNHLMNVEVVQGPDTGNKFIVFARDVL